MTTIYKYVLTISDTQTLRMPQLATILKVANQGNELVLYAKVDTSRSLGTYNFRIFGTGHEIPDDMVIRTHLDTVLMPSGSVWHVYLEDIPGVPTC